MKGIKHVVESTCTRNGKTTIDYTVEYHSGKTYDYKNETLPATVLDFILTKPSKVIYTKNEFGPYAEKIVKLTIYR